MNPMNKTIAKVWTFESSSSNNIYETLQYIDGSTSCDCPGWTRRAQRICKHTRAVDMGIADQQCISCHDYQTVTPTPAPIVSSSKSKSDIKPKVRKISWK